VRWLEPKIDREVESALEAAKPNEPPHDKTPEAEFYAGMVAGTTRFVLHFLLLGGIVGLVAAAVSKLF
jgi:hypothetical protein